MAVYKGQELEEQSIYGSSRLGLVNYASKTGYRSLGGKKYELSNHLGNVLAVVSDNIHLNQDSTWTSLINTTDYYPFGLAMDGRSVQDSAYRYGFNGKEEDGNGEWGSRSHYDYGFRIYNPSIAKFLSVDPLTKSYPMLTPYQFASNRPIDGIDLDGLEYWNSTSIYSEGVSVSIGNFYGGSIGITNGTAWDMIGKTQFKAYTAIWPGNQNLYESSDNPRMITGAEVGVDAGFSLAFNKPTFSNAMEAIGVSMSTVGAKWGWGGSLQFGENVFGIRAGAGIGGSIKTGDQSVIYESISISKSEAEKIKTGKGWYLNTPIYLGEEGKKPTEALSEIMVDGKSTGVKVFSGVIEKNNKNGGIDITSDGNWKSQSYSEKEKDYKK
nr:RHS repeat-associated core domain-containing protein [Lunatimonas salinarum]